MPPVVAEKDDLYRQLDGMSEHDIQARLKAGLYHPEAKRKLVELYLDEKGVSPLKGRNGGADGNCAQCEKCRLDCCFCGLSCCHCRNPYFRIRPGSLTVMVRRFYLLTREINQLLSKLAMGSPPMA